MERTRFEERNLMVGCQRLARCEEAIENGAVIRVRRPTRSIMAGWLQMRSSQWLAGLTSVVVRQAAQAWLTRMGIQPAPCGCLVGDRRPRFVQMVRSLAGWLLQ